VKSQCPVSKIIQTLTLHGKSFKISLVEDDALKFVKKVFELAEELYA